MFQHNSCVCLIEQIVLGLVRNLMRRDSNRVLVKWSPFYEIVCFSQGIISLYIYIYIFLILAKLSKCFPGVSCERVLFVFSGRVLFALFGCMLFAFSGCVCSVFVNVVSFIMFSDFPIRMFRFFFAGTTCFDIFLVHVFLQPSSQCLCFKLYIYTYIYIRLLGNLDLLRNL